VIEPKLTLLPYGPPSSSQESQEKCYELLCHCDADPRRILDQGWIPKRPSHFRTSDQPTEVLDRFLAHASRLSVLRDPELQAIVMLTESCPVSSMIVTARRTISMMFPVLSSALWIIYADPDVDPSFERSARRLGDFDPADMFLDQAPYWRDKEDKCDYLVLTPQCEDGSYVRLRARMLAARRSRTATKSDPPLSMSDMRKRTFRP
jgi:hypothetical protein